jgi:hypothetical protein
VQIATCIKTGAKHAVKILKKQEGKEDLLLQLQSECGIHGADSSSCCVGLKENTQQAGGCVAWRMLPHAHTCVHGTLPGIVRTLPHTADIVKEVAIMRLLADHPNTVQLYQVGGCVSCNSCTSAKAHQLQPIVARH